MLKAIINTITVGSLALASNLALAKTLTTYDEIANSLEVGESVLLNFKPEKCIVNPEPSKDQRTDRVAVKLTDLFEWHSSHNGGKSMRVLGTQESGLFGNKKFDYYRNITLVFEDGTVMILADHVNPTTFNLETREQITCKLSTDGSGGVTAKTLTNS